MAEKTDAMLGEATHEALLAICPRFKEDASWTVRTDKADCSCGCRFFHTLEGQRGADWGVCWNHRSPRCGLLTFEHMGCDLFDYDERADEE